MDHHIEATVRYLTTEEGGRKTPARTGYRPTMNYDGKMDWSAEQEYPDNELVYPGDEARAYMFLLTPENHIGKLIVGKEFALREGSRVIARGVVTRVFPPLDTADVSSRQ